MTSVQRNRTTPLLGHLASRLLAQGLFAVGLAAVGGCSADVTRFDFPAFNLTESSNTPTGSLPKPGSNSLAQQGPGYYDGPRGAGLSDETNRGYQPQQPYYQSGRSQPGMASTSNDLPPIPDRTPRERVAARGPAETGPPEQRYQQGRAPASGETIEVQPGDTLFGIAKRHNVQVGALIEVNGLPNGTSIKPGQRLLLPTGATPARTVSEPRTPVVSRPRQPLQTGTIDTSGWTGRHTLNAGESPYAVARQYRVSLAELLRVNAISDATKIRAGTVLQVPGTGQVASEPVAERPTETAPSRAQGPINQGPRVIAIPGAGTTAGPGQPMMGSGGTTPEAPKIASRGDTATDASPNVGTAKFRWPVTDGRLIGNFGKRPDGTHNDGINLAVPLGTEVRAAEGGKVAYAGNELKGYGNLVLIRHENGWVTAYAHSDEILVKRDDVVRRGQVIARAGKTGTVDQTQVHFELRQGAKPVDPLPYLERN
jgi:murein DD-endopeptidase MepM/ murein hydrolase activator NlpD